MPDIVRGFASTEDLPTGFPAGTEALVSGKYFVLRAGEWVAKDSDRDVAYPAPVTPLFRWRNEAAILTPSIGTWAQRDDGVLGPSVTLGTTDGKHIVITATGGTGEFLGYVADPLPTADYRVRARFRPTAKETSDEGGNSHLIGARCGLGGSDKSGYVFMWLSNTALAASAVLLQKIAADGSSTLLVGELTSWAWAYPGWDADKSYFDMELEVVGPNLVCRLNGRDVLRATDATITTPGGPFAGIIETGGAAHPTMKLDSLEAFAE